MKAMKNRMAIILIVAILVFSMTSCQQGGDVNTTASSDAASSKASSSSSAGESTTAEAEATTGGENGSTDAERHFLEDYELKRTDGTTAKLSDLTKKHTLIVFWATWCRYCIQEMPILEELSKRDDVAVVMVNTGDSLQTVADFEKEGKTSLTLYVDEESKIAKDYRVTGFPTILFATEERELMYMQPGKIEAKDFEELLKLIDDYRTDRGDFN